MTSHNPCSIECWTQDSLFAHLTHHIICHMVICTIYRHTYTWRWVASIIYVQAAKFWCVNCSIATPNSAKTHTGFDSQEYNLIETCTYGGTTDDVWPYTWVAYNEQCTLVLTFFLFCFFDRYNSCDVSTFHNQTLKDDSGSIAALHLCIKQKYNFQLSVLSGQHLLWVPTSTSPSHSAWLTVPPAPVPAQAKTTLNQLTDGQWTACLGVNTMGPDTHPTVGSGVGQWLIPAPDICRTVICTIYRHMCTWRWVDGVVYVQAATIVKFWCQLQRTWGGCIINIMYTTC